MKKTKPAPETARAQVAALPIRRREDGAIEVLLVTSRTTRRWIVPKGWPIKGLKDHDAAAREALEEAGVIGKVRKKPFGRYNYWKRMPDHFQLCNVTLYLLQVERQLEQWAEREQRTSRWLSPEDAALLVDEPELAMALRELPETIDA
ncbi:NUDIX hydrolase [Bosea sp. Leaf344]|uniref:NUDIX hydrolase n=1 Tax=Bosea sp. Leaf344 TaxID=1736346 RepID=UPI0006F72595|nr:NUDIX hydrolase [Bosea sp. Leaf344]KQU54758.1 NUDIX hydrolase [Bosea sp. Leaf344]